MCFLPDEAKPLASISKAIFINVGTLQPIAAQALPEAAKAAFELKKPWVLDPVAAGLGGTRTAVLKELKEYKPDIIRGNASEIMALANIWELQTQKDGKVDGVDATDTVEAALPAARVLAIWTGGAVAISGETDMILDTKRLCRISGGSSMLKQITGAGCSLGAVMAVYASVSDAFTSALTASLVYKWASEKAYKKGMGVFSFQTAFVDNLSLLDAERIKKYAEKSIS
jgi:hydroxyethylthiazole kinase